MSDHGLTLLESEMDEIEIVVARMVATDREQEAERQGSSELAGAPCSGNTDKNGARVAESVGAGGVSGMTEEHMQLSIKVQHLENVAAVNRKVFESVVAKLDALNEAAALVISEWNENAHAITRGNAVAFAEYLNDLDYARKQSSAGGGGGFVSESHSRNEPRSFPNAELSDREGGTT